MGSCNFLIEPNNPLPIPAVRIIFSFASSWLLLLLDIVFIVWITSNRFHNRSNNFFAARRFVPRSILLFASKSQWRWPLSSWWWSCVCAFLLIRRVEWFRCRCKETNKCRWWSVFGFGATVPELIVAVVFAQNDFCDVPIVLGIAWNAFTVRVAMNTIPMTKIMAIIVVRIIIVVAVAMLFCVVTRRRGSRCGCWCKVHPRLLLLLGCDDKKQIMLDSVPQSDNAKKGVMIGTMRRALDWFYSL